jgi:hypothetical protein
MAQGEGPVADARPEFSVREGCRPIVVQCADEAAERRFLTTEIVALLKYKHYTPRDICVLAYGSGPVLVLSSDLLGGLFIYETHAPLTGPHWPPCDYNHCGDAVQRNGAPSLSLREARRVARPSNLS